MAKTYYDELKIEWSASTAEIKRQYRIIAKTTHPDAKLGSEKAFAALLEAYDVLIDPEKRKIYDKSLEKPVVPIVTTTTTNEAAVSADTPIPEPSGASRPSEPLSTAPISEPPPDNKKKSPITVFRVIVVVMMLLIIALFLRIQSTWSTGITGSTPAVSPSISPSPSPSDSPMISPSPSSTPDQTPSPTSSPSPTVIASPTPTSTPTTSPSPSPTATLGL
jgi:curved DNA-binding protein CbpA